MGDIQAGQNSNVYLLAGITILICAIAHFIYKIVLARRKEEAVDDETETETGKFLNGSNISKRGFT